MSFLINKNRTKRVFLNPNNISRHLYCCICQDVFSDPVRAQCGHTFCYICIQRWAALKKHCPVCKKSFGSRELEKDLLAIAMVDDLEVKCMHESCKWQGVESVRSKHQRFCVFKPRLQISCQFNQKSILDITDVDQTNEDSQVEVWFQQK